MTKTMKIGLLIVALAGGLGLASISSFGTMEIAKKEKKACTTCHIKLGSKELNAVGKCYEKHKSLNGCETPKTEKKK